MSLGAARDPLLAPGRYDVGMSSLTLLGPQYREPNLGAALAALGLRGPFACISAGWQEREGELDELRGHVHAEVVDLGVYQRAEDVYSSDRTLRLAHRARQAALQEQQDLYTLQLRHAKDAARELFERRGDAPALRRARRQSVATLRRLDRAHLATIRTVHAQFEREFAPATRPAVAHARAQLAAAIAPAQAILIAGGHVAVLLNRLRLLGAQEWLPTRPMIAWSAGAMAIAQAVVLFHDYPPQGSANIELIDAGLGLLPRVLPLPHAQTRLSLHDATRVALLARRFAPQACLTLDHGSLAHFEHGRLQRQSQCFELTRSGVLAEPAPTAPAPTSPPGHADA
jgi:hypothetical protein